MTGAAFGLALDPASYRDESGSFIPARQVGVLMSLERLFVSLQTILTQPRDDFVRSLLLFDVLDVLDGLGFDDWNRMVTLRHVEADLARLKSRLPAGAGSWLLPRCAEAVEALRAAVDGFSPAYVDEDFVQLRSKSGVIDRVARDRGYASLLRLTRNASHSYREHAKDPREVSLLASHDGRVPARLAQIHLLHAARPSALPGNSLPRPTDPQAVGLGAGIEDVGAECQAVNDRGGEPGIFTIFRLILIPQYVLNNSRWDDIFRKIGPSSILQSLSITLITQQ